MRRAYDGIADLVGHVGGDVSQVCSEPADPPALYWYGSPTQLPLRHVVTVGDTLAYGLAWSRFNAPG